MQHTPEPLPISHGNTEPGTSALMPGQTPPAEQEVSGETPTAVLDLAQSAPRQLDVVDLSGPRPPGLVVTTLPIAYPAHWLSPVRLSPFARTIEDGTIAWMDSLGLVADREAAEEIRAMEPCHYGGHPHSLASYEHALAFCQYVTMWLLWDDVAVEKATSLAEVQAPLDALAGDGVAEEHRADPYVLAFKHLGDEYERLGASRAWRTGFADAMREWARQAVVEEGVRRKTAGADRPFEDVLALRVETNGLLPTSMTLERAVGIELPEELRKDPDYRALLDHAGRVVCIVNDLVATGKDLRNGQEGSNSVLCNRQNTGSSLREAYAALIGHHDRSIEAYDHHAEALLPKAQDDFRERLAAFLSHLRFMCSGFALWHTGAARYRRYLAVENGQGYQSTIARREPGATSVSPLDTGPVSALQ